MFVKGLFMKCVGSQQHRKAQMKALNNLGSEAVESAKGNIVDNVQPAAGDPDSFNALKNSQTTGEGAAEADHDPEEEEVQALPMADFDKEAADNTAEAQAAAGGPENPQAKGEGGPDHALEDEDEEGLAVPGLNQDSADGRAAEGLSVKQEVIEDENKETLDQQVQKLAAHQMAKNNDEKLSKILSSISPSQESDNQEQFNETGVNGIYT